MTENAFQPPGSQAASLPTSLGARQPAYPPPYLPTYLLTHLPTTNIRPHFEFYNFLKVFLGGHDDFGPSGHQSAQESIIPHLLGESYNIPRMDLPSIGLCVEIDIPAFPGFCQIRPIWVPKTFDFGKCSNRQSDTAVRQLLAWEAQIRP